MDGTLQNKIGKKRFKFWGQAVFLATVLILVGFSAGEWYARAQAATYEVSPFGFVKTASYIIYKSGTTYYAIDGTTGVELTSGTDAATVIEAAIDALTSGGLIFFKYAIYEIGTSLEIPTETSTTTMYSSWGKPNLVEGATSHSYNSGTNILTVTVTHGSSRLLRIHWNPLATSFSYVREMWGKIFLLVTTMLSIGLIAALFRGEIDARECVWGIIGLAVGTGVLIMALQVIEAIG